MLLLQTSFSTQERTNCSTTGDIIAHPRGKSDTSTPHQIQPDYNQLECYECKSQHSKDFGKHNLYFLHFHPLWKALYPKHSTHQVFGMTRFICTRQYFQRFSLLSSSKGKRIHSQLLIQNHNLTWVFPRGYKDPSTNSEHYVHKSSTSTL